MGLIIHRNTSLVTRNALLRFKSVCKEWYTLINGPLFIQLHLKKSLESSSHHNRVLLFADTLCMVDDIYHPSKITTLTWPEDTIGKTESVLRVGLCNGLACFRVDHWVALQFWQIKFFLICNPSMRTFKIIPPPYEFKLFCFRNKFCILSGFGYDSEHDDYKIVVTSRRVDKGAVRDMQIYSLKGKFWRNVTPIPSPSSSWCTETLDDPVFGNNMLHFSGQYGRIARFDLSFERWMDDLMLPVPDCSPQFGLLDGCFYQCASHNEGFTDAWIMENYRGKESSWSKRLHLPLTHIPIARSKEDPCRFVLVRPKNGVLSWYDQQEKKSVPFELNTHIRSEESIDLCIGSLVSIPDCSLTKMEQVDVEESDSHQERE